MALALLAAGAAFAQELAPSDAQPSPAGSPSLPSALKSEARRYIADGEGILFAPFHWNGESWTQAAAAVGSVLLLTAEDNRIDAALQRNRSSRTDAVAKAVTPLGSYAGIGVSVASLGAGLIFHDAALRDTGRDAIEAEIFAAGIVTPLLKKTVGRLRPSQGSDGDEYRPLSSGQSFPSGHTTEAFAVASVIAARSDGWVVPTVAYTLASAVGFARMNDRAHFASDVVAGAVIGTAIGHSVVHRHTGGTESASWSLVPVASRSGAGLAIRIQSGP